MRLGFDYDFLPELDVEDDEGMVGLYAKDGNEDARGAVVNEMVNRSTMPRIEIYVERTVYLE